MPKFRGHEKSASSASTRQPAPASFQSQGMNNPDPPHISQVLWEKSMVCCSLKLLWNWQNKAPIPFVNSYAKHVVEDTSPKVHQLNVKQINLAKMHSVKQAKLCWVTNLCTTYYNGKFVCVFHLHIVKKPSMYLQHTLHLIWMINSRYPLTASSSIQLYFNIYTNIKINKLIKAVDRISDAVYVRKHQQFFFNWSTYSKWYSETTSSHLTTNYTTKS